MAATVMRKAYGKRKYFRTVLTSIVKKQSKFVPFHNSLVNDIYFYLVIAGNFAGHFKVTPRVHSENNESVQTT